MRPEGPQRTNLGSIIKEPSPGVEGEGQKDRTVGHPCLIERDTLSASQVGGLHLILYCHSRSHPVHCLSWSHPILPSATGDCLYSLQTCPSPYKIHHRD